MVDRCDEGPAEASLSCLPLTPYSHQCIPCPEHNGLGDSGPHCGFGWPRFRPQFSCLWDDASVYLKILQLHERCEGVVTQWLLPHLSGLFLYPRGTVGQLEAPAWTLFLLQQCSALILTPVTTETSLGLHLSHSPLYLWSRWLTPSPVPSQGSPTLESKWLNWAPEGEVTRAEDILLDLDLLCCLHGVLWAVWAWAPSLNLVPVYLRRPHSVVQLQPLNWEIWDLFFWF